MKRGLILSGIVVLLTALFTSCSQKNYYAFSYAPSGKAYHETKSPKPVVEEELVTFNSSKENNESLNEVTNKLPVIVKTEKPVVIKSTKKENVLGTQTIQSVEKKTVSRKEKKALKKQLKAKLKELKSSSESTNSDIDPVILAVLSIIFPLAPLMMYLFEGDLTDRFWISLILTLLFWLPGVIYNFLVMFGVI